MIMTSARKKCKDYKLGTILVIIVYVLISNNKFRGKFKGGDLWPMCWPFRPLGWPIRAAAAVLAIVLWPFWLNVSLSDCSAVPLSGKRTGHRREET